MTSAFLSHLSTELDGLKSAGLYKSERVITSTQSAEIEVGGAQGAEFLRQQLSRPRRQRGAARGRQGTRSTATATAWPRCASSAARRRSTSSSRRRSRRFLGMEDTILYGSCFDANGGLFETLLGEEDAVISDALNHASIIDGVRLSKAKRFRYANNDMADLEARLKEARGRPLPADRHRRRVLDGRHHRQSEGRLRPRREIRCDGDGRRQPRRRLRRQERPRLGRALRRRGQGRHHHRHARQGAGRRLRRLHVGQERGGRLAAPALAALSLLQHADAGDRRRVAQGLRADRERRCAAREALRQRRALPRRHDQGSASSWPAPAIRSSR